MAMIMPSPFDVLQSRYCTSREYWRHPADDERLIRGALAMANRLLQHIGAGVDVEAGRGDVLGCWSGYIGALTFGDLRPVPEMQSATLGVWLPVGDVVQGDDTYSDRIAAVVTLFDLDSGRRWARKLLAGYDIRAVAADVRGVLFGNLSLT